MLHNIFEKHICFFNSAASAVMSNESSHIPMLTGENFSDWKEKVLLSLGCMDLDLALRMDEPLIPTESSTPDESTSCEWWERSNHLCLMFIKSHVGKGIRSFIPECTKAKEFLNAIEQQYMISEKALASTLMNILSSMKHVVDKSVCEHIMEIRDIAAQLNSLNVTISELFLVQFVLDSLSTEYGSFKIFYNTHKKKWTINELLTMCVQEEGRFKQKKLEIAHLVNHGKG